MKPTGDSKEVNQPAADSSAAADSAQEELILEELELEDIEFDDDGSDGNLIEAAQAIIARKAYRLPVRDKDDAWLKVGDNTYPLIDISVEGVCIETRGKSPVSFDGFDSSCEILLGSDSFAGLEGEVVHTSFDYDGVWMCGIRWLNMDEQTCKRLEELLLTLRKEMFEDA